MTTPHQPTAGNPEGAACTLAARRNRQALILFLALAALAGAFAVLRARSNSTPPLPPPKTDTADPGDDTTENGSTPPYELSPAEVPEKGPGERMFGSCQAFESDSELWIFLDVDVRIPRPAYASPTYGGYQLALHTFVLDKNGVKASYATPPTLTANSNITYFFRHNSRFYAWQWHSGSNRARLYRWTESGFEELSPDDCAALEQQLGIAGLQHRQMKDRLREIAERNGFRRVAEGRPPPQIVSERLGLRVGIGDTDSGDEVVAESLGGGQTWREVLLEVEPHWSGTTR